MTSYSDSEGPQADLAGRSAGVAIAASASPASRRSSAGSSPDRRSRPRPGVSSPVHPGRRPRGRDGEANPDTRRCRRLDDRRWSASSGRRSPSAGDDLICRFVGNRWVAERCGGRGRRPPIAAPGLPLRVDARDALHMTSSSPAVQRGDVPELHAGLWADPGRLFAHSPSGQFLLPQHPVVRRTHDTGDTFRYYLSLRYRLLHASRRVYLEPRSSARPITMSASYTWSIGASGNSCQPVPPVQRPDLSRAATPPASVTISE